MDVHVHFLVVNEDRFWMLEYVPDAMQKTYANLCLSFHVLPCSSSIINHLISSITQ